MKVFKAWPMLLGLLLVGATSNAAQVLRIPRPPNVNMMNLEDVSRDRSMNAPYRFAVGYPTDATTLNQGTWRDLGNGQSQWTLDIVSDGAISLNLGFSQYFLPRSARLTLTTAEGKPALRPFTSLDNARSGQLWTPPVNGSGLHLELTVANAERSQVRLRLGVVNYGYRDYNRRQGPVIENVSGACNVDVACNTAPAWNDPIRSVAAITVGGTDTCTGSFVNNTAGDRKLYFLTAFHCRITARSAASMVAILNYQNSNCRAPNTPASAASGDGKRDQFISGATFRAGNAPSDFTLVEMTGQARPEFNIFWAGWDHSGSESPNLTGIHHPAVAEKRISHSDLPSTTTSYLQNQIPGDGTHIRVTRWTQGTTEPGSSGSPLFDVNRRVIGQLHGGGAACNRPNDSDWFGRLSVSWEGGGTPDTRLKDWLDPRNAGVPAIDGLGMGRFLRR